MRALALSLLLWVLAFACLGGISEQSEAFHRACRGAHLLQAGDQGRHRLFATAAGMGILEIDHRTGAVVRRFQAPADQGVGDGLAFDGSKLYYLSGSLDPNRLHVVDADSGELERSVGLPESAFRNGLGYLDGLVYVLDWSATTQELHAVDPTSGQVVRRLDIDAVNAGAPRISGGLAGITGPNALLVTTVGTNEVLEIDPMTGHITNRFEHGLRGAQGVAVAGGRIYVAANTGAAISIFTRSGRPAGSITVPGSIGFQSLGGDDAGRTAQPLFVPIAPQRRR